MAQNTKVPASPDVKVMPSTSKASLDSSDANNSAKSQEIKAMDENTKTSVVASVNSKEDDDDGGDSSWEDEESGDNNRLEIDEPKKKKVRRKRAAIKSKMKYNNVEVPEEIIRECNLILDNTLDNKARSLNMSSSQVKMVLKSVIQSPELLAMLRNAGAAEVVASDPAAAAEPKMTRAMIKKCQEVGDTVWIVPPITPQKAPNAEIMALFSEEWPEETGGDDPDFFPDLDPVVSDEDSMFSISEHGTPGASQGSCSVYTTPNSILSESRTLMTPSEFKRPNPAPSPSVTGSASRVLNFEGALTQAEGYATRSRMPLTDTTIEQLEQQFIPFDITPDMYEINCDNDDYSDFLKTLYAVQPVDYANQSGNSPLHGFDDPTDPEFVFPIDEAAFQLKDPEELRDDRATKITKKEVSELMAELLYVAGPLDSEAEVSDARSKRKSKQPPGSATKKKRSRISHDPVESEDTDRAKTPAQVIPLSDSQISQIRMQVQQHTQLLTQMALLSSHSEEWRPVRDDCDTMLSQTVSNSLLTPYSVLAPTTLYPSLAALEEWNKVGSNPILVNKNTKVNKKKRHSTYHITEELMDFMAQKNVFQFPSLLPISGLNPTVERIMWQPSEDQLLAQAIERFAPETKRFGKKHMTELSFAINSKAMPAKTPQQIQVRIKNLKQMGADDNPVKRYYEDGVAPDCHEILTGTVQLGNTLTDMVAHGRKDDIPALWLSHVINRQTKIKPAKLPVISPKPQKAVIVVKPIPVASTPNPSSNTPEKPLKTADPDLAKRVNSEKCVFVVPNSCGMMKLDPGFMSTPVQILCVDGTNGTPGSSRSTSESDTPSTVGSRTQSFSSPPPNKFSTKKVAISSFTKSPLKAASDRILKKYTSPHKRPLRELRKRPVVHQVRMSPPKSLKSVDRLPVTPRRLVPKPAVASPVVSIQTSPTLCASPQPEEEDRQADPVTDTPTGPPGKRGTRRQKEAEVTLALLGELETAEEKEAREARESTEMFEEICNTISGNASLCEEFDHIMSTAIDVGTCQTYLSLHRLLDGHPLVQELLLDLLSPEDSIKLGFKTRVASDQRRRMKRFVLKLARAYQHQPAYHAKVLRELESVSTDPNLTPNTLKLTADRLFKSNQHLLDEFLSLVPGVPTPESMLPSPETLDYPGDSDQSWDSDEIQMETMVCKSSPPPPAIEEPRISSDDPRPPCKCPRYLKKPGPCQSCNVRFVDGEVFIMDGKILKPAHVEGWGKSVENT